MTIICTVCLLHVMFKHALIVNVNVKQVRYQNLKVKMVKTLQTSLRKLFFYDNTFYFMVLFQTPEDTLQYIINKYMNN